VTLYLHQARELLRMSRKINAKSKGNRAERELAKLFKQWWGSDFARTPSSGGFHTKRFRSDWNAEADIVTTDTKFPFAVECKWQENWFLEQLLKSSKALPWKWWKQACYQAGEDKTPLLVFKRSRHPWYYMLPVSCADRLLESYLYMQHVVEDKHVCIGLLEDLFKTDPEMWWVLDDHVPND